MPRFLSLFRGEVKYAEGSPKRVSISSSLPSPSPPIHMVTWTSPQNEAGSVSTSAPVNPGNPLSESTFICPQSADPFQLLLHQSPLYMPITSNINGLPLTPLSALPLPNLIEEDDPHQHHPQRRESNATSECGSVKEIANALRALRQDILFDRAHSPGLENPSNAQVASVSDNGPIVSLQPAVSVWTSWSDHVFSIHNSGSRDSVYRSDSSAGRPGTGGLKAEGSFSSDKGQGSQPADPNNGNQLSPSHYIKISGFIPVLDPKNNQIIPVKGTKSNLKHIPEVTHPTPKDVTKVQIIDEDHVPPLGNNNVENIKDKGAPTRNVHAWGLNILSHTLVHRSQHSLNIETQINEGYGYDEANDSALSRQEIIKIILFFLLTKCILFVFIGIPQSNPDSYRFLNLGLVEYNFMVMAHTNGAAAYFVATAICIISNSMELSFFVKATRGLVILLSYSLACIILINGLVVAGLFPFPFSAVVVGVSLYYTTLCPGIYFMFGRGPVVYDAIVKSVKLLALPFFIFLVEQGFTIGMYTLNESVSQVAIIWTFQLLVAFSKVGQRLVIGSVIGDSDKGLAEGLVLSSCALFDLVGQFFILMASPQIWQSGSGVGNHGKTSDSTSVQILAAAGLVIGQSIALLTGPVLDTKYMRDSMVHIVDTYVNSNGRFKNIKPIIIQGLQLQSGHQRRRSLRVCFVGFMVRFLSPLAYLMASTFISYGYNLAYFPTYNVSDHSLRTAYILSAVCGVSCLLQLSLTRPVLYSLYKYDLIPLGFRACLRFHCLMVAAIAMVYCQSVIPLVIQQNAVQFLLKWGGSDSYPPLPIPDM